MSKETRKITKAEEIIESVLIDVAKNGEVITYQEMLLRIAQKCPSEELSPKGRRWAVDFLDDVNARCCGKYGVLPSVVVVGDNGMPDSGFFDKFRAGKWTLPGERFQSKESHDIFRQELAKVYEKFDAPINIHVFMDLENTLHDAGKGKHLGPLEWLAEQNKVQTQGWAFVSKTESIQESFKSYENSLTKHRIEMKRVWKTTAAKKKGASESDAELLMVLGGIMPYISRRDFVCFIIGGDKIYRRAVESALDDNTKVLCFCETQFSDWKISSKNEHHIRFFDFNQREKWVFPMR